MFAKPNEIGSVESLTTEIENVAGSLRLNVALPFEARRYEFSLPAGEGSLDASIEDEVPVLRRVIDTHAGEVIRTTSLPTVIKEVCIARFGGVCTSSEWFSARATLSPSIGTTDDEVRNAIGEFESASEPVIMTDGGRPEVTDAADLETGDEVTVEYRSTYGNNPIKEVSGEVTEASTTYAYMEAGDGEFRLDVENIIENLDKHGNPNAIGGIRNISLNESASGPSSGSDGGPTDGSSSENESEETASGNGSGATGRWDDLDVDDGVPDADEFGEFVSWADVDEFDVGDEVIFTFKKWDYTNPIFSGVVEEAGRDSMSNAPYMRVGAERGIEQLPAGNADTSASAGVSYEEQSPEVVEFEEPAHFALSQRAAMRRFDDGRSNVAHSERGKVRLYRPDDAGESEPETDGGEEVMTDGGEVPECPDCRADLVLNAGEYECLVCCEVIPEDEVVYPSTPEDAADDIREARSDGGRIMTDGGEDEQPPRWRDWSNVKGEKENRLMTDGGEDDLPDISGLEPGNEVRVFYRSQRSGNEVDREGTVSAVVESEGKRIVRVHTGNPEPLKYVFMGIIQSETESGREGVFAFSQTATAEMPFDGAPKVGKPYLVKFEFSRTSILGEVDRIVRTDRSSPIMMTDGGSRVHPDDEGVEILGESNNDSDIIEAPDDGAIISDGGFDAGDWRVVETQSEVPDWERVKVKNISEEDAREYARKLNSGPSGRAGYLYGAEKMPDVGDDEGEMTSPYEEEYNALTGDVERSDDDDLITDGGQQGPPRCPNGEEILEPKRRGGDAMLECPECGYQCGDPLTPSRRRYRELQTEYRSLVDRYEGLKSEGFVDRADELLEAISAIEKLLNDWDSSNVKERK